MGLREIGVAIRYLIFLKNELRIYSLNLTMRNGKLGNYGGLASRNPWIFMEKNED